MAHHPAIYNPHHFSLALKSDVTEKQVADRFDRAARFFFLKDKSTEDHHNVPCPSSKRLNYLETSVLMMYHMGDD